MVHTRAQFHSYAHWALRLDPDTLRVTHVSAGAVLQTAAYFTEGYLQGVLTVGSFHVLQSPQGQARLLLVRRQRSAGSWQVPVRRILAQNPVPSPPKRAGRASDPCSRVHCHA